MSVGCGGGGYDVEAVFVCELKVEDLAVAGGGAPRYEISITVWEKG